MESASPLYWTTYLFFCLFFLHKRCQEMEPAEGGRNPTSIEDITGAFVNAIKRTLDTREDSSQDRGSSSSQGNPASVPRSTSQDRSTSEPKRKKEKRYNPPTLFESLRRDPKRKKGRQVPPAKARLSYYVRDIVLLPSEFKGPRKNISIPRSKKRTLLAQAGLVGKIELNSGMEEDEVREEVCRVFSKVMGITETEINTGKYFNYTYLQRAGAGSRTLCMPSVKDAFRWNGRQVSTLAKSGGTIYILAEEFLPGWMIKVLLVLMEAVLANVDRCMLAGLLIMSSGLNAN